MVGMDIKHAHLEVGLVPTQVQQSFTLSPPAAGRAQALELVSSSLETGDQDDEFMGFEQLTDHLIAGVAAENIDSDPNELPLTIMVPAPSGPLMITILPLNSAILSPQATQVTKTCIPLESLFNYTADRDHLEGMNSFWKGGITNLENEMKAYEVSDSNEESSDCTQPEVPNVPVDLDMI
ncbi:hypothetical protein EDB83DRAFT_2320987 [Lactarius deliciosus]|nr:hypothetical protein EDB83DRAFT_2320987 [Lactarius deliciosus]